MKLIVGLGNPEKEYENTRHNAGFLTLDALAKNESFAPWKHEKKFHADVSSGNILTQKVLLAKPRTFMNLSGQSVAEIAHFYTIAPKDIFVIHDDLDLDLAVIRISQNASSGGHKGVESVIEHIGTRDFVRFRLGIATPAQANIEAEKYVLQKFSLDERTRINAAILLLIEAIETALSLGIPEAMNEFN